MPHKNALNFDSNHNSAIRKEIGYRLRAGLIREPTSPPRYVQDLLDRLTTLDDAKSRTMSRDDDTSR
jgi:hypothetical protein